MSASGLPKGVERHMPNGGLWLNPDPSAKLSIPQEILVGMVRAAGGSLVVDHADVLAGLMENEYIEVMQYEEPPRWVIRIAEKDDSDDSGIRDSHPR